MMYGCANSIVLSKVKDTLGLDQCKACFTAAAPIAASVIKYFGSLDIPLYVFLVMFRSLYLYTAVVIFHI